MTESKTKLIGRQYQYLYFLLHNTFSLLFFFAISEGFQLYQYQTEVISEMITIEFGRFILTIVSISFIASFLGRFLAFIFIYGVIWRSERKVMRSLKDLNSGLNEMDLVFFLSTIISSILYSFGTVFIVESVLFGEYKVWSLILAYIIVKIIVYIPLYYKYK